MGDVEYRLRVLGLDRACDDEVFRQLVLARVVEPTSKLDSIRVLDELGITPPSYPTIKRRLPVYAQTEWRQQLAAACAAHVGLGPATLVLYDVTTLYFETDQGDGFREPGFSKERRLEPQITVGLLTRCAFSRRSSPRRSSQSAADHRRVVDRCAWVPFAGPRPHRQHRRDQDHDPGDQSVHRRLPAAGGDGGRRRRHDVGSQLQRPRRRRTDLHRRCPDPRRALPGRAVAPRPSRPTDSRQAGVRPAHSDGTEG